jgi:TPR repeat protein
MMPLQFVCWLMIILGRAGFQQDKTKAMELYVRAADLGNTMAHNNRGNLKKTKFHFEAAAMAGDEVARYNIGLMENNSGNVERAVKHWTIAASAGDYKAMQRLIICFEKGHASKELIDTALAAYNSSCAEMRSEARDACIRFKTETN